MVAIKTHGNYEWCAQMCEYVTWHGSRQMTDSLNPSNYPKMWTLYLHFTEAPKRCGEAECVHSPP